MMYYTVICTVNTVLKEFDGWMGGGHGVFNVGDGGGGWRWFVIS